MTRRQWLWLAVFTWPNFYITIVLLIAEFNAQTGEARGLMAATFGMLTVLAGVGVWVARYRVGSEILERWLQIQTLAMATGSTAFWIWAEAEDAAYLFMIGLAGAIVLFAVSGWLIVNSITRLIPIIRLGLDRLGEVWRNYFG